MVIDQTRVVMGVAKITFPVPAEPSMDHVQEEKARRKILDDKDKKGNKDSGGSQKEHTSGDKHGEYAHEDEEERQPLYMKKY
jgi:hypothetical protein